MSEQGNQSKRRPRLVDFVERGRFIVSAEWEMKEDRRLDGLDDAQLRYLHAAIEVTLDERGWVKDAQTQKWIRHA